ncbi:MAG: GntR family transcriptional regulator [Victivallales bacterium]|nr:GntR family transcriptional regulator [Victivallales bacterium]
MTAWTVDIPKCDRIAQELAERIRSGEIPNGARLTGIRGLALQHQVSNKVIELALDQLEGMGLIKRQVGRGTFVNHEASEPKQDYILALASYYYTHNFESYLYGLTDELLHHNMSLLYSSYNCEMSKEDKAASLKQLDKIAAQKPDFILIDALYLRDYNTIRGKLSGAKACAVHNELPYKEFDCSGVFIDYTEMYRGAYEYLLNKGHRKILALGFNRRDATELHPREAILAQALELLGEKLGSEAFPYISLQELQAGITGLDKTDMPTAMIGLTDYISYLGMSALEKLFPGMTRLEIIGLYDTPWSKIPGHEFHTFNMNFDQIWSKAITLLSDSPDGGRSVHWVKPTFIER